MKLRPTTLATLALLSALAQPALADERRGYIVRLADEPAATYAGGVAGYAATQAVKGRRFVFEADVVQAYVGYLKDKQEAVAALVGNAPVYASYTTVLNGFAARLTDAEVLALKANAMVRNVQVDEIRHVTTSTTPKFLGLSEPGGLWSQTVNGGLDRGEDIVIGVIDTGVWPENPAFADHVDANGAPTFSGGTLAYGPAPASFTGSCVAGEGFDPARHCNNKLIGAKVFNAGLFGAGEALHWSEFNSARDSLGSPSGHGGHGTHTASTAGGNSGVPAVVGGVPMGNASGMAPRARIAVYKVCSTYNSDTSTTGQNSCFSSDSVAAIEEAVKDGVNVINYSISGSQTTVDDPVEQAFLKASNAGVFVAAAAGNSGPDNQVNHPSPWLATVAASTHDRLNKADVVLGNGARYSGASVNMTALPARPMILSILAALPGADANEANRCYLKGTITGTAVLDPAKVQGKIVVCARGTNPRVEKSQAVAEAGGAGMIMIDDGNGLVAEAHAVPTVHVSQADGGAIKSYAAAGTGTSTMGTFYAGTTAAPLMAAFSSRGPNKADGNVLKPDFAAPGVDVIAGVAPGLTKAERNAVAAGTLVPRADWTSMQGTSMATPHVAGLAALLKQAHPDWSPAAIKSALATTTRATLDDGLPGLQNGLLPWAQGTGNVLPNKATDPGLVYDAGLVDWIRYQCNVMKNGMAPEDCASYGTLDATYNLNLPSLTVANVPGSVTVTRTVTNVGSTTSTYTATASVPNFNVGVTPASLTLAPGESKSFTVAISNLDAPDGIWTHGSLVWRDGNNHVVTSPVNLKMGKSIVAPDQVTGSTASGTRLLTVKTGFTGRMTAVKGGLKDVTMGPVNLLAPYKYTGLSLGQACQYGGSYFAQAYTMEVPAGTIAVRWALRQEDTTTANDDHDIIVLDPNGKSYVSGNAGSNESVQLVNPLPGPWRVCVGAYEGGVNGGMSHRLSSWIVGPNDTGGKFTVLVPGQVYAGGTGTVGISWSGLPTGKRYFGGAVFKDAAGVIQSGTAVRVETNGGLPLSEEPRVVTTKDLDIPH